MAEGPDGLIYVSNIGGAMAPMTKDGDGRIDILDASGFVVRRNALVETRRFPKGAVAHVYQARASSSAS